MESNINPSTPLKVLEEKRKVETEAMGNTEEEEVLCAKAVEHVSQSWEALIDNTELEQVTDKLHTAEADVNKLKNELKMLLTVEKMPKDADMKKLQYHVARL